MSTQPDGHLEAERIFSSVFEVYSKSFDQLPAKERIHFLRRAYRVTGDEAFASTIRDWTESHTIPAVERRGRVIRRIIDGQGTFPPVRFKPSRNTRTNARNHLLEKRPELQFFRRYSMDLFQAKSSGLDRSSLREQWPSLIESLQRFDFDRMYVDLDVLRKISSFAVNTVIFWDHLDVDNSLHRRFLGYMRGAYFEDDLTLAVDLDDAGYTSLVYNLTHAIIGYSKFYQQWTQGHRWIAEYLAKDLDRILRTCSYDVIAEVGMSFKLMQLETEFSTEAGAVRSHIVDGYDFEQSLSPENLARLEHTNVLMMLLFHDTRQWYPGPEIL